LGLPSRKEAKFAYLQRLLRNPLNVVHENGFNTCG